MEKTPKRPRYATLMVDYVAYKTHLNKKFKNRKAYVEKDPRVIAAVIPGTIRKVYVKPGQKIREGDKLLILEAMKMKNIIYSEQDGVIRDISVKPGTPVAKNHVMIVME
ncbi:MAG: acetyl-CoA carboxylase biotin carboxyl carrier protein subunit [Bacteroidales bacterium]